MKFPYYSHKKSIQISSANIRFPFFEIYSTKESTKSTNRVNLVAKKKRRKRFETEIWIATLYTRRKHNRTPMVGTTPGWNVAAIRWSVNSRGIFSRHAAGGGVTNRLCCTLCSIMIYLVKRRTGQRVSIRTVALDCEFRQFAFRPRLSSFSPYTYVYIYRERERKSRFGISRRDIHRRYHTRPPCARVIRSTCTCSPDILYAWRDPRANEWRWMTSIFYFLLFLLF